MGRKWIKISAWIFGGLAALLLLLTLAVWLLLPAEKIKSLAAQKISAAAGRECTIEGLGLSLWHGLALDLSGVELAAGEGEEIPYTARLEHLYLKMKLLPLFQRRVEVVSLIIDNPELYIVRDKNGELNLSKLGGEKSGAEPEADAGSEAFSLLLLSVEVSDAVLHYHDYQDSLRAALAGIDGELNMLPGPLGGDLPVSGSLSVNELRELVPGSPEDYARVLPAKARFEGAAAGDWSWIELNSITFTAGGVQLDGPLRLDLKDGETSWKLELEGRANDLSLINRLILPADFPREITGLDIKLASDGKILDIGSLEVLLGEDRITLSGTVELEEPYKARGDIDTRLALEGLKDFAGGGGQWTGSGDLNAKLNLSAELARAVETWRASGTVTAGEIAIDLPESALDLKLSGLQVKLSGRDIQQASLIAMAGGSDLNAELSVVNWPGLLPPENQLSSGRARWKLNANSATIDFVELFGQEQALLDTLMAWAAADTSALPIVLGDGAASLRIGSLVVREGVMLDQAGLWLTVRDSLLRVDSLAAGMFGGRLFGGGEFVLAAAGLESWALDLRAADVRAGELLRPFSSFGQYLNGTVSTGMSLRNDRALDESPLAALTGGIDFSFSDGAVKELPALNAIAGLTKIDELRDLAIDDWVGRLEIRDGRVFGDNLALKTAAGLIGASGSVGLDGSLDYDLTLALNQRLSDKYRSKLPGEIGKILTGGSGPVELAFDLSGTTADPKVKLNAKPIAKRAGERLQYGVSKLIDKLVPDKSSTSDSSAGDSAAATPTAPDSTASLKQQLPGMLNKLLKKKLNQN